jgi:hypothetical protein
MTNMLRDRFICELDHELRSRRWVGVEAVTHSRGLILRTYLPDHAVGHRAQPGA